MDSIESYLEDIIKEYVVNNNIDNQIDNITAISLLRSSIELENPELPKSSVIIKDLRNPNVLHSVKLKNIKFNLSFALDMVLGIDALRNENSKTSIILMVIKFIHDIFSEADIKIKKEKAKILIAIYKLDYNEAGVTIDKLLRFLNENHHYQMDFIEKELKELEDIKCITCVNGRYHLIESIIV